MVGLHFRMTFQHSIMCIWGSQNLQLSGTSWKYALNNLTAIRRPLYGQAAPLRAGSRLTRTARTRGAQPQKGENGRAPQRWAGRAWPAAIRARAGRRGAAAIRRNVARAVFARGEPGSRSGAFHRLEGWCWAGKSGLSGRGAETPGSAAPGSVTPFTAVSAVCLSAL